MRWERAHRLPEAVECYLVAGGFDDAARVLSHLGWFFEAGLALLLYLPPGQTSVRGLNTDGRRLLRDASLCFARGAGRAEAVGLLMALGETEKAANLLIRAGLRQEAVAAMRGEPVGGTPWPPGVVSSLMSLDDLLRRVQEMASAADGRYRPVVMVPERAERPEPRERPPAAQWPQTHGAPDPVAGGGFLPSGGAHPAASSPPRAPLPRGGHSASFPPAPPRAEGRLAQAPSGSATAQARAQEPRVTVGRASTVDETQAVALSAEAPSDVGGGADSFVGRGTLIRDRYLVETTIGAGGMATVYKAMDQELKEEVALKMFRVVVEDPVRLKRFRREMKINRRLRHPNIVQTYEYGTWRGARYITMELLQGEELSEFVHNQGPDLGQRIRLMMQACDGLGSAHDQGIVHRDIKPSNLFVVDGGKRLKVMDFGIAKAVDSSTISVTGVRVGTPRYMSPEQIQGNQPVGPAADLYALGAVMYEVFTGRPVFDDDDLMPLLLNHLSEEPTPPSEVAPGLFGDIDDICMRLLAKNPRERFVDCAAVKSALLRAFVKAERR